MRCFRCCQIQTIIPVCKEIIVQTVVNTDVNQIPVIQAAAAYHFVRNIKTKRADQMQTGTGCSARSGYSAGIMRDLRFDKNNINQTAMLPSAKMHPSFKFHPILAQKM